MSDEPRQNTPSYTYEQAGVSIEAGNALVKAIGPLVKATMRPGADGEIGGFGGFFDPKAAGYKDPLLVAGNDGVGTKLKLAIDSGKHDTVGIDLVAMCVNDLIVQGAEPLFFLDYFATGKLENGVAKRVIAGIAEGCKQAGCALIGGETAEMPGMYAAGDYDLAGFCVGAVERGEQLTGERVAPGHILLGLASSGVHSNGYSLVRKIVDHAGLAYTDPAPFDAAHGGRTLMRWTDGAPTLGEVVLNPTRIYCDPVVDLLNAARTDATFNIEHVRGICHITGGGLSNLLRLHPSLGWDIHAPLPVLPEFTWLQSAGGVETREMYRTFNMGMGMVIAVDADHAPAVVDWLKERMEGVAIVGHVRDHGHRVTHAIQGVEFSHY